jgi:recombination protein RecA
MKIGVMFGNPETTSGGNALKFYCSVRLDIRRIASIKQADEVVGNRARVKVVKNKVAPPFREIEFDIMYGEGISKEGDLLDLAVKESIIDKAGAWYSYENEKMGQGRENSKIFLKENPEIMSEIKNKVLIKYNLIEGTQDETTPSVDLETGEIIEEKAPKKSKKTKKTLQ